MEPPVKKSHPGSCPSLRFTKKPAPPKPEPSASSLRLVAALALVSLASSCDTAAELAEDRRRNPSLHDGRGGMADLPFASGGAGDLHLVPQTEGDLSPACLDGSPYGFYFVPSTTNSTKWTVSISGGLPARDIKSSA